MRMPKFEIHKPQILAAAMLCIFALQCLWVVHRQSLTRVDYEYARCGRELWERPSPLAGYLTSCGNISDGTFAYRVAGLPLTVERILLGQPSSASPWEMRHLAVNVLLLLRLPFILFGVWLGGGIWWVSRRLYGNEGGFLALALYCFSPEMVRVCIRPNNEILAAWGLYGVLYTAVGLAHAMQGPRKKWRPRMVLLTVALGLTATAHVAAAVLGLLLALAFMLYLAEKEKPLVAPALAIASAGGFLILVASYAFHLDALSYVFQSADARMWLSWQGSQHMMASLPNAGITIAALTAAALYLFHRRSRYFGNTTPLIVALILLSLETTGGRSEPWIWALPFLLTFTGGVFADMLESRRRRMFLWLTGALVVTQAVLTLASLPLLVS
ncbi:MAG: hypothetical protein ACYCSP_15205 [Acidobacteriaceae bacterium]